jgi:hypothetical protein
MRALKHDFGDGRGLFVLARISVEHLDCQGVADIEINVREGDVLPASCVRQTDSAQRLVIVAKSDLLDAAKFLETALRMQTPVGTIDSVKWRPV